MFGSKKRAMRDADAAKMERLAHEKGEQARDADRLAAALERSGDPDLARVQRQAAGDARWSEKQLQADAKQLRGRR